ncbi:MAG: hypothetical protein FD155_3011 [Bacteroidetes bacterium]|nr:MAG: hypothetical protein FD155_3011 [Bacteroidota bacterium]
MNPAVASFSTFAPPYEKKKYCNTYHRTAADTCWLPVNLHCFSKEYQ